MENILAGNKFTTKNVLTRSIEVKYVPLFRSITLKTSSISRRKDEHSLIMSTSNLYGTTSFVSRFKSFGKIYIQLKGKQFSYSELGKRLRNILEAHINASQNETNERSISFCGKLLLHIGLSCNICSGWIRFESWV